MAKISPVSIKYMIYAKFEAEGALDKPDVIGALFGQTEGLLGKDLELRELQKEGKIGRIEVDLSNQDGKTIGKIEIPSALDKTETTLIAAAIETIERIGPTIASIKVEKIEDVRQNKREYILERAKSLLEELEKSSIHSKEIKEKVNIEKQISKLKEYGEEKLPAGDLSGEEIIVVEGRADVINLLKNGIENVIGMNGTKLPKEIKNLGEEKILTLFLDGDRGGYLIAKNAIENANIDYITFAPDGKEVEQLTDKEILQSLRKKIPCEEFISKIKSLERKSPIPKRAFSKIFEKKRDNKKNEKIEEENLFKKIEENKEKLKQLLRKISKSNNIILLDYDLNIIKKINSKKLYSSLKNYKKEVAILMIDKATRKIIETAENFNIGTIIANNFTGTGNINLLSF
ncbi:MAG: DNA primase DnaG [Candidatus Pacearchaeota archaeon]